MGHSVKRRAFPNTYPVAGAQTKVNECLGLFSTTENCSCRKADFAGNSRMASGLMAIRQQLPERNRKSLVMPT
jgi:hypothetical protein